jgi:hypothetical protein
MKRELDHLAALPPHGGGLQKKIGFKGQFYIEPKPQEPTTHQYDSDAAACLNFLREYDLLEHFKLNIETNHATLAGHTMEHELTVAVPPDALGSIDANMGDPSTSAGTPTSSPPTSTSPPKPCSLLKMGGFTTGGLNFDANAAASLGTGRPLPRPHRRHGRLRPRPQNRRRHPRRRPHRRLHQGNATAPGTAASARKSKPAKPRSPIWRNTRSPTGNRWSPAAARK